MTDTVQQPLSVDDLPLGAPDSGPDEPRLACPICLFSWTGRREVWGARTLRVCPQPDATPHGTLQQWLGDSRGHWEADTLVLDTVNFRAETNFYPKGHGPQPDDRTTAVAFVYRDAR